MNSGISGKTDQALAHILKWGCNVCLAGLLVLIAAGIFVRFVPISSMGWADEVIELAFAYMVFLGAASLMRDRTHFRVDMIPLWMAGSRAGRGLEIIVSFLALVFFSVFAYEGFLLTLRTTDNSPILDLPKILWYVIMPLSGAVLIGYAIRDLWLLFRGHSLLKE